MNLRLKSDAQRPSGSNSDYHARSLRAIGQELAKLMPQSYEIRLEQDVFHVRVLCTSRSSPKEPQAPSQGVMDKLRTTLTKPIAIGAPPAIQPHKGVHAKEYPPDEITCLDEVGLSHRQEGNGIPDIYSLGEVLRMIGRSIDAAGGRLNTLVKSDDRIVVEYLDAQAARQHVEFTLMQLYRLQQEYYTERRPEIAIDKWTGLDR